MSRACSRCLLPALAVVALCVAWAIFSGRLFLFLLRELYRIGEQVGITRMHPAPGSRLAGQILGFNYSQPPTWWTFTATALAAAGWLAPMLLPALWLRRRIASRRTIIPSHAATWLRGPISLALTGIVFAALYSRLLWSFWNAFLWVGERLGGSVARISGQIGMGARGPFFGDSWADDLGNLLARHGPMTVIVVASVAAAALVHAYLWHSDLRRAAAGRLCTKCGYDLSATPTDTPCPECGHRTIPAGAPR